MNTGPCMRCCRLPTSSTQLAAGLLGNAGWVFSSRILSMLSTLIPMAPHPCGSMGYWDIWYSTKMLQGPFSRSGRLYACYFLALLIRGVPLGAITSAFREYDFAYNEAQIRRLLGWHTCNNHTGIYIYSDLGMPSVIRAPVYDWHTG